MVCYTYIIKRKKEVKTMTDNSWLDSILKHTITIKCRECGQHYFFTVDTVDYADWFNGVKRIDNVFPNLSKQDKKAIETHICLSCRKEREKSKNV